MSEVEEKDPLENMIDFAANAEFNKANDVFNDVLTAKVQHALEQEKVAVAQGIWQDAIDQDDLGDETIEVDEDGVDMDISDEALDQAAEDALEDDFEDE